MKPKNILTFFWRMFYVTEKKNKRKETLDFIIILFLILEFLNEIKYNLRIWYNSKIKASKEYPKNRRQQHKDSYRGGFSYLFFFFQNEIKIFLMWVRVRERERELFSICFMYLN